MSDFRVGSATSSERTTTNNKSNARNTKHGTGIRRLRNRRAAPLARSLDEVQTFATHVAQLCDSEGAIPDPVIVDSDEEDDGANDDRNTVEIEQAAVRGGSHAVF